MGGPIVGGGNVNVTGFCLTGGAGASCKWGADDDADDARLAAAADGTSSSAPPHPPTLPAPSPSTWRCRRPGRPPRRRRTATAGCGTSTLPLSLGGVRPTAVPLGGGRLRVALTVGASASLRTAIRDGHGRCAVEYSDGTTIDGGAERAAAHASAEEVVCVAPAAAAPGGANVSVSSTRGAPTSAAARFGTTTSRRAARRRRAGPCTAARR